MSWQVDRARERLNRANRYFKVAKVVFRLYLVAVTALLAFQLYDVQRGQTEQILTIQDSLEKSLADNARQHERTQNYVKCVASSLLVPVAQRSDQLFDRCGIEAGEPSKSEQVPVTPSTPAPTSSSTQRSTPPQTTSSPPEPEASAAGPGYSESDNPTLLDGITNIVLSPLQLLLDKEVI